MNNDNLFFLKKTPSFFYCYETNKWKSNFNFGSNQISLKQNDIITLLGEIDDESALTTWYALITGTITGMVRSAFFRNVDSIKTDQEKISRIKENFKLYLANNKKTIIIQSNLAQLK